MKLKKIIFKTANLSLSIGYLIITLAFSAGLNIKTSLENNFNPNEINSFLYYNKLFDNPWEIAEAVVLILLALISFCNLIFRKKKCVLVYICIITAIVLFILKFITQYVDNITQSNFIIVLAVLRMIVLYQTFLFLTLEKRSILKLFYRDYTKENYNIHNRHAQEGGTFTVTDKKEMNYNMKAEQNNEEIVILNNVSPIKANLKSSITPRRISLKNEVQNKLPLLLVEKVKIPKFINEDVNNKQSNENNNSIDTLAHSIIEDISGIYKKKSLMRNDKYSNIISELNRISEINFNVFKLSKFSDGSELLVIMFHLMHICNYGETLQINKSFYKNYFYMINKTYRKNSYHNSIHACDVTQTLFFIIKTCNIEGICNLSDLDLFSCFFASAIHDLDHPGNNNNYEIATSSTLAISYNDKAVLENYHLAKAFSLIRKSDCDVFENFSRTNYNTSRAIIINMVLSTDMANHFLDLSLTQNRIKADDFNPECADKQLLLNQLIHAADISNPMKPMEIYKEWVKRVFKEFYIQGDKERQQGLKISYLCDRYTVNVMEAQIVFIEKIVYPLYATLLVPFPNMNMIVNLINNNKSEFIKMKELGETIIVD